MAGRQEEIKTKQKRPTKRKTRNRQLSFKTQDVGGVKTQDVGGVKR